MRVGLTIRAMLRVGLISLDGRANATVRKEREDEAGRQRDFEVFGHRFNVQVERRERVGNELNVVSKILIFAFVEPPKFDRENAVGDFVEVCVEGGFVGNCSVHDHILS